MLRRLTNPQPVGENTWMGWVADAEGGPRGPGERRALRSAPAALPRGPLASRAAWSGRWAGDAARRGAQRAAGSPGAGCPLWLRDSPALQRVGRPLEVARGTQSRVKTDRLWFMLGGGPLALRKLK
jgi:hypothetical protein